LRASVGAQYVPCASCSLVSQRARFKGVYEQINYYYYYYYYYYYRVAQKSKLLTQYNSLLF